MFKMLRGSSYRAQDFFDGWGRILKSFWKKETESTE